MMHAIVKKQAQPGLWLEKIPIPKVGPDEVLIKSLKTAICGTDVHIYQWDSWAQKTITPPLVIGHEFMGVIAEIGQGVSHLKVGMRVTGEGHLTCGHCTGCKHGKRHLCSHTLGLGVQRHGCYAEYFTLPAENVFPLPDFVPDNIAAIFDPFGNAVHTAFTLHLPAQPILITGAGPIGLMGAAIAHRAGASRVIISDTNPKRLELAKKMGATDTVNVREQSVTDYLKQIGFHEGVSGGMEMSGNPSALSDLLKNVLPGGTIALLGILPPNTAIDWDLVIFKLLHLRGIYGRKIFETWDSMVNLIQSGLDLTPLVTHQLRFDEFEKGFEVMKSGLSGKVILDWA